jgi:hypothetical protein
MNAPSKRDVFAALYGNRQALDAVRSEVDALREVPVVRLRGQSKPLLLVDHDSLVRQSVAAQIMQADFRSEALLSVPAGMRVVAIERDSIVYEALDRSDDAAMTSEPGSQTVNRRALYKRRKASRAAKLSRRRNR